MPRHSETSPETALRNAVSAPFTAQEISDAIAAVEKDRREEAAREAETAQIAQVLEQLGMDLPAQTVAERVRDNRSLLAKQDLSIKSMRDAKIGALAGLAFGLVLVGFLATIVIRSKANEDSTSLSPSVKLARVEPGTLLVTNRVVGGTPVIQTFAEVADGVPVAITADKLRLLLAESLPEGMRGSVSPSFDPACEWTVLRKSGEYYVRGYVKARMSPAACLAAPAIRLYNRRGVGTPRGTEMMNGTLTVPIRALSVRRSQSQDFFEPSHALDVKITNVDKAVFGE